jgi:hypothetical protein
LREKSVILFYIYYIMKTALYIYKNMFTLNQSNKESYMILITPWRLYRNKTNGAYQIKFNNKHDI